MNTEYDLFFCYEDLSVNRNSSPPNENNVHYAPVKGDWDGGDEVLMVIPKLDRRKGNIKFMYS